VVSYSRDGKIEKFTTYLLQTVWLAQLGIQPNFAAVLGKLGRVSLIR
jgi:hypothetical protein